MLNATQHKQNAVDFLNFGIEMLEPDFTAFGNFDPKKDTRKQCLAAWRNLLDRVDEIMDRGGRVDGYLLGGYAPAVLCLFQFLANMRHPSFVAVMGQAPIKEGERRQFVLAGVRRIPTPHSLKKKGNEEGQPLREDHDFFLPSEPLRVDHGKLIHLSARPLTEERATDVSLVAPQKLIGVAPVLPPPADHDLDAFEVGILDVCMEAVKNRCGVLVDGAPAETFLRVFGILGHALPFYFLKTEVKEGQKLPSIVALEKIPQF